MNKELLDRLYLWNKQGMNSKKLSKISKLELDVVDDLICGMDQISHHERYGVSTTIDLIETENGRQILSDCYPEHFKRRIK